MQEDILLKKYRTGTTITYFDTMISENNYPISSIPAALYLDSFDSPMKMIVASEFQGNTAITTSNQIEVWHVSGEDNIQRLQEIPPGGRMITGRTFSQFSEGIDAIPRSISEHFNDQMYDIFSGQSENFTFVQEKLLDDFSVNIKLERSFDILNTLSTYNKAYKEFPVRNAQVGVVFGKLEAIQKIKDEEGNFVRVPLIGVPIGIFQPGNKFGSVSDVDKDGNRIRLNFKSPDDSWPNQNYYFDALTYQSDFNNYLPNMNDYIFDENNPLIEMPAEFQNTVLTNEYGEFIIHDVPVGAQTLMFEVDLLQQGMTQDEVALNFYPYSGNKDENIGSVPHFFFRQIPIDVVPAWGEIQSGYTEVNIKANLDLRKWATYFFPPACNKIQGIKSRYFQDNGSFKDEGDIGEVVLDRDDNSSEGVFFKIGDPALLRVIPTPLTVEVRDMTKISPAEIKNSNKSVQMVQVEDMLDRKEGKINVMSWQNEFSQIRDRVEFRKFGYNAIRIPANIYDPNGYKTQSSGIPKNGMHQKGVWLCSYQFKMYHANPNTAYRTTGFYLSNEEYNNSRDNYHINSEFPDGGDSGPDIDISSSINNDKVRLGNFPFEKSWSINYPTKYSIPKKPFISVLPRVITHGIRSYNLIESPSYTDGHLVGIGLGHNPDYGSIPTGGFGHARFGRNTEGGTAIDNDWYATSFSYYITNSELYHYEYSPFKQFGMYANGYFQEEDSYINYNDEMSPKPFSHVDNGEEYQRVEAGHGYYLHPFGLPRVGARYGFDYSCEYDNYRAANTILSGKTGFMLNNSEGADEDFYFSKSLNNYGVIFDEGHTCALRMDYDDEGDYRNNKNQGALSIYRIVNPGSIADPTEVYSLIQTSNVISYKCKIDFQRTRIQNARTTVRSSKMRKDNNGDQDCWTYWTDIKQGRTAGLQNKAYMTIKNNGATTATVKVNSITYVIASGTDSDPIFAEDIDTWDNMIIELESNAERGISENEGPIWAKFDYSFSFYAVTIPKYGTNGDEYVNCSNMDKYNIDFQEDAEINSNEIFYVTTRLSNIKTRTSCSSSTSFINGNIITVDGFYFINGDSSTILGIDVGKQKAESALSNETSWCAAYDGYYHGEWLN